MTSSTTSAHGGRSLKLRRNNSINSKGRSSLSSPSSSASAVVISEERQTDNVCDNMGAMGALPVTLSSRRAALAPPFHLSPRIISTGGSNDAVTVPPTTNNSDTFTSLEYKKDDDHYSYTTTSSSSRDISPDGGSPSAPSSFSSSGEYYYHSRYNSISPPTNDPSKRGGGGVVWPCCHTQNNNSCKSLFVRVTEITRIVALVIMLLLVFPIVIWDTYPTSVTSMATITSHATLFWNSILQFPVWPVVFVTLLVNAVVTSCPPPMLLATTTTTTTTDDASMTAAAMTRANYGNDCCSGNKDGIAHSTNNNIVSSKHAISTKYWTRRSYYYTSSSCWWKMSLIISISFSLLVITNMTLQMIVPHVLWNPFIWGRRSQYPIYLSNVIVNTLEGTCLDDDIGGSSVNTFSSVNKLDGDGIASISKSVDNINLLRGIGKGNSRGNNNNNDNQRTTAAATVPSAPLCLSENQWNELSSGKLSSLDPDDVATVKRGLRYLRNESGGLVINALARNVADSIPALRHNMDGLSALFRKYDDDGQGRSSSSNTDTPMRLSLVIFENDSTDGTREIFQQWANDESSRPEGPRYIVDIMSCGPMNPECKLGIVDRYDVSLTLSTASGVGRLGEFRQTLMNYILTKEEYQLYSHMIVLDVDLGISISPLGLLHTLGLDNGGQLAAEYIVASSSKQVWPGTLGAITPPYDFSAFRPKKEESNKRVRTMHKQFCQLLPVGDRWRNLCDASSPMQLFMIQSANDVTNHDNRPYEVTSAFNGLTMYPLDLIRNRGIQAHYDAGVDGQQCEHVSFHLSLAKTMYVNPKWTMNLRPERPGGPSGWQACKTLFYAICGRPIVVTLMVLSKICLFFVIVSATWVIGTSLRSLWPLYHDGIWSSVVSLRQQK